MLIALFERSLAAEVVQLDLHCRNQNEVFAHQQSHKLGNGFPEKQRRSAQSIATDFCLSGWYLLSGKADSLNLPADSGHKCHHSQPCCWYYQHVYSSYRCHCLHCLYQGSRMSLMCLVRLKQMSLGRRQQK